MLDQRRFGTLKCDINTPRAGVFLVTERCQNPVDCTLEMRRLGWAHFAGKGLQIEAEATWRPAGSGDQVFAEAAV